MGGANRLHPLHPTDLRLFFFFLKAAYFFAPGLIIDERASLLWEPERERGDEKKRHWRGGARACMLFT